MYNRVTLIGYLGRDPEVRALHSGGKVCSFRLATSETWRDKQTGERRERTEWHNVVIWTEGLVKIAEQYLRKGSCVLVEGQLETREWEKDGEKRYTTEVVLRGFNAVLKLMPKGDGQGGGDRRDDGRGRRDGSQDDRRSSGGGRNDYGRRAPDYSDHDDYIPF